ncbi:MAG: DUF1501 domain-containing protein [Acidobacteriia bacterium]|nr:DUF1501 domain-containing protein [Terriglobia bacterium]MYG03919.1 DUF1501 domain-containing protein [Terriglobia bacterium]MYK09891.1 DUF1501 domain-containing protein [Terriglobia bacterium]
MSANERFVSRRDFLFRAGEGISGIALAHMLQQEGLLAAETACDAQGIASPTAPREPHFKPRAKAVISLFMSGGVSHVDTFDHKPMLEKHHGQPLTGKGRVRVRQGYPGPLMRSPFKFQPYGECGKLVSELFPHMGAMVDDLAFVHSCKGRSNDHVLAHYEWNTGSVLMGHPSVGSWVTYGLGSENQSLPGFVVVYDHRGGPFSGPSNWSSGYLPATYQGTVFRSQGDPILDLQPPSELLSHKQQRARLDHLATLNEEHAKQHPGSTELAARIASYELAYRMQGCAPEAVDVSQESEQTKALYGMDDPVTEPFGRQCLLARRLVERGVRFVQLYSGALRQQNIDTWDAHSNLIENHTLHAGEVDKPIAGLLKDLKRTGLLDDTLVVWHSEFGRMPISQRGLGRDHNPHAMTAWMAGAGIRGGQSIGATDEFGYKAEEQVMSYHDIHATMLHMLGMDHKRLTYFFNGRHMRLTDVHGEVIPQLLS